MAKSSDEELALHKEMFRRREAKRAAGMCEAWVSPANVVRMGDDYSCERINYLIHLGMLYEHKHYERNYSSLQALNTPYAADSINPTLPAANSESPTGPMILGDEIFDRLMDD